MGSQHPIGLLLATEEDWPTLETLLDRVGPSATGRDARARVAAQRIRNEPFNLRHEPRWSLVIDRLSWWYDLPREWLKKIALMDELPP